MSPDLWRKAGHGQLPRCNFIDQQVGKFRVLAQWQANIFGHGQRAEQATMLKQHAPALAQGEGIIVCKVVEVVAEHPDGARIRAVQQDHFA